MLVADYTSKIKGICDSLASIEVNIEENEMVQICLRGLAPKFAAFRTVVCTREKTPSFFDLQSMLLIEENHAGASMSTHTDNKMLYMEGDRPRGCGGRGESVRCRENPSLCADRETEPPGFWTRRICRTHVEHKQEFKYKFKYKTYKRIKL